MHPFCINRSLLGEQFDLCVSDGKFRWSDGAPEGYWSLGDDNALLDIKLLAKLSNMQIRDVRDAHRASFSTLRYSGPVQWRYALSAKEFDAFIRGMLDDIEALFSQGCVSYYTDVFKSTRECLNSLEHARVDDCLLEKFIADEANETNRSALRSLAPNSCGFANKTIYDQTSTITGRLTVASGPRILTLPKRHRSAIVSRYDGGSIVFLDFRSLEPNVILGAQKRKTPEDVYSEICSTVLGGKLDRKQAKIATIALLYGAQESTASQLSGLSGKELKDTMKKISEFFLLDAMFNKLLDELKCNGKICNFYGRPIIVNDRRKLLNYYAQSSAVDVALLGFWSAVKYVKQEKLRMHPLFVIHDCILFDVHPDDMIYIGDVIKQCENVPGFEPSTFRISGETKHE
jgi:hypothetical protein